MDSSDRRILERSTVEPEQANSLVQPPATIAPVPGRFWSRPHTHAWLWIIPLAGAGAGLLYWSHSLLPETGAVATQGSATIQIEPTLRVNWIGGDLSVTWRRDALTQQTGERGILRIIDGGVQKEIPLTAEQLQLGQRLYTPLSNDFRVELDIVRLGQPPTTEAIQVLSPGKYAYEPPRRLPAPTEATQASRVPAPVAPPASVPTPQTQTAALPSTPLATPRTQEPQRTSITPPVQPPVETPVRASTAPEPVPAAKPSTQTASNTAAPEPVPMAPPPTARPEPAQQAQASNPVPTSEAPVSSPLAGRPSPSFQPPITPPAAAAPSRANPTLGFVPAQPMRTVQATIPDQIRAGLNGPAQVDVRVSIDITGRVTNTSISGQTGTVVAVLRTAAESAARQWRFQPARLRGQAVSSAVVLRFRFTPENSRSGL